MTAHVEKFGSFFLGNEYDLNNKKQLEIPLYYYARDLYNTCINQPCLALPARSPGNSKTGSTTMKKKFIAVHDGLKLFQYPDEPDREFMICLSQASREKHDKWENIQATVGREELTPRRNDVSVHSVSLAWLPFRSYHLEGRCSSETKDNRGFLRKK